MIIGGLMDKGFGLNNGEMPFVILCLGLIFLGIYYHNTFIMYLGIAAAVVIVIVVPIAVLVIAPAGLILADKGIKIAEKLIDLKQLKVDLEAAAKKSTAGKDRDAAKNIIINTKDWEDIWKKVFDKGEYKKVRPSGIKS